ncbi:hypothetical protein ACTJJ7_11880 [Phyllobacterium sp. 22229]|uniref:Uncharacterized protein n=1 Tax=Agrobacterium radiobacter TaxID=362 RepID=A0ABD5LKY9_AGRRD
MDRQKLSISGVVATIIAVLTFYFAVIYKHRELTIRFTELPSSMVPDSNPDEKEKWIKIRVPFINDGDRAETIISARLVLVNDVGFDVKHLVGSGRQEGPIIVPPKESKVATFLMPERLLMNGIQANDTAFPIRSIGIEAEWLTPAGEIEYRAFYPYTVEYGVKNESVVAGITMKAGNSMLAHPRLKEVLLYDVDWYGRHLIERSRQRL